MIQGRRIHGRTSDSRITRERARASSTSSDALRSTRSMRARAYALYRRSSALIGGALTWAQIDLPVGVRSAGRGLGRGVGARLARLPVPDPLRRRFAQLASLMTDEVVVTLLAIALSIAAYSWYASAGYNDAFNDARIRAMIARRVVRGRTPGLAQLGTVWLPLDFLLMLPLIWNDTLFRDGFAASLPSMVSYVLAALYLYRTGQLLFSSRAAGWVAAAVLMLNPSLLYLQSTAMSEMPMICAAIIATFYFIRWARGGHALDLVITAAAVAAGTLIRYDGWDLACAFALVAVVIAWRRAGYRGAEAATILYGLLAFVGCVGWVIYNWVIFHDPLLFLFFGNTTHDQSYQAQFPAYHKPILSIELFGYSAVLTIGGWILLLAGLGLIVLVVRYRLRSAVLPVYALLVPIAFYWLVIYLGYDSIDIPELGMGDFWNVRFGLQLIPAVALLVACLASQWRPAIFVTLGVVALFAVVNVTSATPYVLREALHGSGSDGRINGQVEARWFASHYHGGVILTSYHSDPSMMYYLMTEYGIPDQEFITDANNWQFDAALAHPQSTATWIIMDTEDTQTPYDLVWTSLGPRHDWQSSFTLRQSFGTIQVYEHVGDQGAGRPAPRAQSTAPALTADRTRQR